MLMLRVCRGAVGGELVLVHVSIIEVLRDSSSSSKYSARTTDECYKGGRRETSSRVER